MDCFINLWPKSLFVEEHYLADTGVDRSYFVIASTLDVLSAPARVAASLVAEGATRAPYDTDFDLPIELMMGVGLTFGSSVCIGSDSDAILMVAGDVHHGIMGSDTDVPVDLMAIDPPLHV